MYRIKSAVFYICYKKQFSENEKMDYNYNKFSYSDHNDLRVVFLY